MLSWLPLPTVAEPFTIEDIRVEGLQRISPGTIFNYLPVKIGQRIKQDQSAAIIRALFKTGFFKDVSLEREGGILIISVVERAAIAEINISGNQAMETENLLLALEDIGLAEGRVFNRSILDKIEQELRRQYYNDGKYAVKLYSTVTPLERNRVAVRIDITEGEAARIKRINIIGNQTFEEEELLDKFQLSTTSYFSFFSKADQYSRQQLSGDLEVLRSFYLDRGFLNFKIDSTQVFITPDKQDIYITINLSEGGVFTISDIKLAGEPVVPKEDLFPLIHISRNDIFSRKHVVESADRISSLLGDRGYAFANVNSIPDIDEEKHQVAVTFFVDPGKQVYVRRINMQGNTGTRDEVLRREMRQMEAAWFSTEQVNMSRKRLQRLGFFDHVSIETPAVPGSTDQVDVNITVQEKPAGNFMAGVGFSQSQGLILSTSIAQNNFLGSGKRVSFAYDNSSSNTNYSFGYNNPYYTVDGVSRGFFLDYRETDFAEVNAADYLIDEVSAGMNFGIPINEFDRIRFDLKVKNTDFKPGPDASTQVENFYNSNGDNFLDFEVGASWVHDSRDSLIFPKSGGLQRFSAMANLPGSDQTYYKVAYNHRRYFPMSDTFTFSLKGDIGYGHAYGDIDQLPFYKNYFAGGVKTVRGYKDYSLGPRDDVPLGGNMRMVGNAELLFPPPFGDAGETVRMSAFFDLGNVFDTKDKAIDLSELRYSTGVSLVWFSPIGALGASLAKPLNSKSGDDTETFQFTLGSFF